MIFNKKNVVLAIIVTLLLSFAVGCNAIFRRPNENQSKQSQEQKKSPPKTLTAMESTTESMMEDIQKVMDKRAKAVQDEQEQPKVQQQDSEGQQEQDDKSTEQNSKKDEQQNQEEGQEEKQQEPQGNKQEQKSDEKQTEPTAIDWESMKKNVEQLQSSWSNYISIAMKDGASNDIIRDYGNQLDLLTTKVMERQEESLLSSANDLYKYYPKFLNLYKHQAPPNIKDMKYYIRKIIIDSQENQWYQSNESLDAIKQAWETARSRMEKPDQDMNQKVQAAMDSFSRSVQQQNKHLTKLKGNILIKILEEVK